MKVLDEGALAGASQAYNSDDYIFVSDKVSLGRSRFLSAWRNSYT
jgi:hypothetical protein